ncbi:MAG: hypothetical protein IKA44_02820, partial [Clostridia bacterium]|nr:hypothetical protein [Clostridia bacterium]
SMPFSSSTASGPPSPRGKAWVTDDPRNQTNFCDRRANKKGVVFRRLPPRGSEAVEEPAAQWKYFSPHSNRFSLVAALSLSLLLRKIQLPPGGSLGRNRKQSANREQ